MQGFSLQIEVAPLKAGTTRYALNVSVIFVRQCDDRRAFLDARARMGILPSALRPLSSGLFF
jgi:hypothetical protein